MGDHNVFAQLIPRSDPNETLLEGYSDRPILDVPLGGELLTLGRGWQTGIHDPKVRRHLVDVWQCDQLINGEPALAVTPRDGAAKARLYVNGEPISEVSPQRANGANENNQFLLFSGDILSLDNLRYEYHVHIIAGGGGGSRSSSSASSPSARQLSAENDNDPIMLLSSQDDEEERPSSNPPLRHRKRRWSPSPRSPALSPLTDPGDNDDKDHTKVEDSKPPAVKAAAATALPTTAVEAIVGASNKDCGVILSSAHATRLSDEIQCCVCLDIQMEPRTLDPCGHTFCLGCVTKLEQCPECRKHFATHVPARMLDNLISTLVGIPGLLEADDVEQYNQRKKEAEEAKVSIHHIIRYPNSRRGVSPKKTKSESVF